MDASRPPTPPRLKSTGLPDVDLAEITMFPKSEPEITVTTLDDLSQDLFGGSTADRPLIDEIAPMSVLRAEYENGNPSFLQQIDHVKRKGFDNIRRARGDGDCFYRSLGFAYVEKILLASDLELAVVTALSALESTIPMLEHVGFQRFVFEDFYDCFVSLIRSVGSTLTSMSLLSAFQDPQTSNSCVVYLRLLTSAQIRTDPTTYQPFLSHPDHGTQMEPQGFCESFVESIGKEADHVQITALSRALQVDVDIAYIDGRSAQGDVNFVELRHANTSAADPITLLYRPGHYDILIKR
jgi:ubiquitin thioesterase protein OTUB1